jgi:hypothetical protein
MTFPINYIIQDVTCPLDSSRETASITLAAVQFVFTAVAWNAIFIYYRRNRSQLKAHRGSRKLNAFQSLVALQSIKALVFPLVTQSIVYSPTKYVSYQDFSNVIPAFMTCWESLMLAILFIKIFSFTPYRNAVLQGREKPATVGRAVLDTLNQMDIIKGAVYLFQIFFRMADKADSKTFEKRQTTSTRYAIIGLDDGEIHDTSGASPRHILQKLNSDDP